MAGPEDGHQQDESFLSIQVLLITASFFLPVALPSLLGWMNGLLAVPVFVLLVVSTNTNRAFRQIGRGLFLAIGGALLLNKVVLFAFGLTLLPLGYSLYKSVQQREDPAIAGGKGVIILGGIWFAFWMISGALTGVNPYSTLIASLDESFSRILEIYRNNSELPPDVLLGLEQIVGQIQKFIPKLMPGLLAGSVIITVWLNMVISNRLIPRLVQGKHAWTEYSRWQYPDKLVWLPIIAVILALAGRGQLQNAGYSLVVVSAIVYLFQGLAIFIHFLDKWNVPLLLRYLIYGIFAVQSYGILMLSVLGLADTWFDLRKLNQNEQINNS
ncbi:MAG: hypothetical protein DSY70_05105 [Desulfobulbus sp.]|nr:MAG: hypothetical protein DSY70_05105 [Desulfobulbus sp.]